MIVKAQAGDPQLIPYIFPGYPRVTRNLTHREEKALYILDTSEDYKEVEAYLTVWCDESVVVSRVPLIGLDLDLRDPLAAVQTLSEYRGIRYAKRLESKVPYMDEEDFTLFVKMSSILKRWYWEAIGKSDHIYNLFTALTRSKTEFLKEYWTLRKTVQPGVLLSSILTFFQRIREFAAEKDNLSAFYKKRIMDARWQEKNFPAAAMWLMGAPKALPIDIRIIIFCLKLRGGKL